MNGDEIGYSRKKKFFLFESLQMARHCVSLSQPKAFQCAQLTKMINVLNGKLSNDDLEVRELTYKGRNVGPEEYRLDNDVEIKGHQHQFQVIRAKVLGIILLNIAENEIIKSIGVVEKVTRGADGWRRTWANVYKDVETLIRATRDCIRGILRDVQDGKYKGYDPEGMLGNRDLQDMEPLKPHRLCLNGCVVRTQREDDSD